MTTINFVLPDGSRREVRAKIGESLKDVALRHSLAGIAGECGGVCACATCHVIINAEWLDVVGGPPEFEDEMLAIVERRSTHSRLGCQVEVTAEMDGLELRVP